METACLRIKFIPLLQKNHKNNSKCCLEIVPEISCLRNLEKLEWKKETNFIEYTIPMTYKVILKKRQAIKDASNNCDAVKTYHSCVDLLISSSKSTLNFGSGDVSKIISDTFIICKTVTHSTSTDNSAELITGDHNICKAFRNYPVLHRTNSISVQVTNFEQKKSKEDIEDDIVNLKSEVYQNIETEDLNKESLDKLINADNDCFKITDVVPSESSITHVVPEKESHKPNSRRRLSLSPICSVSTQESPLDSKVVSKAVTCKMYDNQKKLIPLETTTDKSDLINEEQIRKLSAIIDMPERHALKRLGPKCRLPPEMRIAKYLQYMEKEVLPMKMIMNDIFRKCSSLGISLSKKSSSQSVMYKTLSSYSSPIVTNSEEPTNSNRVVYSIVFDG